jgi:thioredoxin-dependent peroxiredoxin
MAKLNPAETAPTFNLTDSFDKPVALSDFSGSKVILYFFPAAMTPGCTVEANDFNAATKKFSEAGYQVIGISPDKTAKLAKFREKESLQFPLLGDPEREVLAAYGAWGTKVLYGKEVQGVIRSTFVIEVDASGLGTIVDAQYNVRAKGHVAKLLVKLGLAE